MLQRDSCDNELAFMNAIIFIGKLNFQRAQLPQGKKMLQRKKAGEGRETPSTVGQLVNTALKTIMNIRYGF